MTLTKKTEASATWCPTSIMNLDGLLEKAIRRGEGFINVYALKRNIAYNLQYLEFLDRCLQDLKLTSVLTAQTYKMFILIGCGIMESMLAYLLIKSGNYKTTYWKLAHILQGQEKDIDGERVRIDSHIYKKISAKKRDEMQFDAIIKKAESKRILGSDHAIYAKLQNLRKLRNKVHLHIIDEPTDTDWNAFQFRQICDMAEVIHTVLTGPIFRPSIKERSHFDYLNKYRVQTPEF